MAIAHQGSTGTLAAAQGSTSISVAYPTGVAAGRIALLFAVVKLSDATFNAVTGFTLIGSQTGGTGAAATDVGTTRVSVWYRELDGSESGSVTVTNSGGVSSAGCMSIYSQTAGAWVVPIMVGGQDTTHGANWSAVCGGWASALAAADMAVVANSTDNDSLQSFSAETITQTGATFGARTLRNTTRSNTAQDVAGYTWDAPVTTGNANAPTWTHTSATSTCGATAIVRLREEAGGVTGVGLVAFGGLSIAASGVKTVSGVATLALGGLTAAAAGDRTVHGVGLVALGGLAATASGVRTVGGVGLVAFGGLTVAASGQVEGSVSGVGLVALGGLGVAASGVPLVHGVGQVSLGGLAVAASGDRTVHGAAALAFGGLGVAAAGDRTVYGTTLVAFGGLNVTAAGVIGTPVAVGPPARLVVISTTDPLRQVPTRNPLSSRSEPEPLSGRGGRDPLSVP